MLIYTITPCDHCRSVDSFMRNLLPIATAGYLHKLLKNGNVLLNGTIAAAGDILRLGDTLSMKESAKTASLLQKRLTALDILHEDDQILVVNKEPGLAVHMSAEDGDRNLVAFAGHHLAQRGVVCRLRPVNRIDRGTSGCVILAKSATAAGMFGRFVKETGLGKIYLAAVSGRLDDEGVIDLPLDGKESLTRYRTLARGGGGSIAAVHPVSGRMHQIRRHLAAIGYPILGDRRYGGPALETCPGHGLHSFAVAMHHPVDDSELIIRAPLPAGLQTIMAQIAGEEWPALFVSLPELPLPAP